MKIIHNSKGIAGFDVMNMENNYNKQKQKLEVFDRVKRGSFPFQAH